MVGGVVLNFVAKTADAVRDVDKLDRKLGGLSGTAKKAGGGIGGALKSVGKVGLPVVGAAVAGVVGLGAAFVGMAKSAVDDAAAADRLAQSLKKSTKATEDQVDAADSWISKMMFATGISDDDLRPALERAARSTKNLGRAQKLTKLAMDISARTGRPLGTVMKALAKANDGNVGALKVLGLTLGDTAKNAIDYGKQQKKLLGLQAAAAAAYNDSGAKSKQYKAAMERVAAQQKIVNDLAADGVDWQKELGREFGGAAAAAGGTLQGTWDRVKLVFAELGEAIGSAALPPLQKFADWFGDKKNIAKVQTWIDKVGDWATAIGEKVAGKLQEFIDWLNSPAGKQAMQDFVDRVKSIAAAFDAVVTAVDTSWGKLKAFIEWANGLPDWLKVGPLAPFRLLPEEGPPPVRPAPGINGNESMRRPTAQTTTTINVTVNSPKPERASASVAAALRIARPPVGYAGGGAW